MAQAGRLDFFRPGFMFRGGLRDALRGRFHPVQYFEEVAGASRDPAQTGAIST